MRPKQFLALSTLAALFLLGCATPAVPPPIKPPTVPVLPPPIPPPTTVDQPGPLPGHAWHGDAFNDGPRQAARLMDGCGDVKFPITTANAEAQRFFNQGVGQLHGFWYFEAERSFRQVLKLDPNCAMAYWGMAMANGGNGKRAKELIAKATANRSKAGERDGLWIDALAAYHRDEKADKKKAAAAYLKALQTIAEKFPDDLEAKAFVALQLYNDSQQAAKHHETVDALIESILQKNPAHPCHHYRIHLWDYKDAKKALGAVGQCGPSSPDIAHMWHMPGHILSRLNRYHDAAQMQEASARVDHAYMMRDGVLPDEIHNYAHNNEWLTRNLSFSGRVQDAVALAKNMIELPRLPEVRTNGTWSIPARTSHVYGRRNLVELLAHYELWDEVLALKDTFYLRTETEPAERTPLLRLIANAHFNRNATDAGNLLVTEMETALAEQQRKKTPAGDKAEADAKTAGKKEAEWRTARTNAERPFDTVIRALEPAISECKLHRALVAGQMDDAKAALIKANDLSPDRKAMFYWRVGNATEALRLADQSVKSNTNQARPLAIQTHIFQQSGKLPEAQAAFQKLRQVGPWLDLTAPTFARLRPVAQSLQLPEDWRLKTAPHKDLGALPPLDTLGPFRWQPVPAADWTLPDTSGTSHSLAQHRGRPLLLVFYLGHGCTHCMGQLNALAPAAPKFAGLGVDVVAISSDNLAGIGQTFVSASAERRPFPFPLLSDAALKTFQAYRAYDDFESVPLHATVLIDAAGKVRWRNIGYEPFMAVDFLLDEAKRMLQPLR